MMFNWGDKSVSTISIAPLYVNNDPEGDEYYKSCIYLHLLFNFHVTILKTCMQTQYFFDDKWMLIDTKIISWFRLW